MTDDPKPQKWWQTVPGILTATAAAITAVTGLVVALQQAGVFGAATNRVPRAQTTPGAPVEAIKPPPAAGAGSSAATASSAGQGQAPQYPRSLAAGTEVRLGSAAYRGNTEELTLRFTVRMTNGAKYPANFWDETFRLLLDGVPRAPVGGLNKLVPGDSAEEGDVEFAVPAATRSAVLQVRHSDESTRIPVDLSATPAAPERTK